MKWNQHPRSLLLGALGALLLAALSAPRNGSGVYTLPAGNPVTSGTVISSSVHNATMADVRDALTQSVSKDGQTPMTGSLNVGANSVLNAAALCTITSCGASEVIGSSGTTVRLGNGSNWTALSTALPFTSGAATVNGIQTVVGGAINIKGAATGAANQSYIYFQDSAATRKGFVGDADSGSSDIFLESDAGNIKLEPASGLKILGSGDGGATFTDMTPSGGTFSATLTGAVSASATLGYYKIGPIVRVYSTADYLGSNGTTNLVLVVSSLPAAIRPSATTIVPWFDYSTSTSPAGFYAGNTATVQNNGVVSMKTDGFSNNTTLGLAKSAVIFEYFLQ